MREGATARSTVTDKVTPPSTTGETREARPHPAICTRSFCFSNDGQG